ncbi:hypothetical protein N7474_002082 [Penicillium riverlandense]|uniref:uncharacterized protein n=1 Tax=Penicillium riverlandense TaxID=1903569 RepID=UPI002549BEBD|nr:uncharacterized protein N7474_002082 [Penicillium riverlandense]KAJ5833771.1 hypothetical protein N7474_002082 [Penicillium riverlandense]
MTELRILICGAGCAGPTLAYWLSRAGHRVTVVERFDSLRASGAQVDIRGHGIDVVERMGLLDTVRSRLVDEKGVRFVNSNGDVKATILVDKSRKSQQSVTSEMEIMRGDLVEILYNATKDDERVNYIFGKTVESFEDSENQVVAHFSDNSHDKFDLLVGADGQGSRIRQKIQLVDSNCYRKFGIYGGYWFVPRTETDTKFLHIYNISGGRLIMRRTHNQTESQVYFVFRDESESEELAGFARAPVEQQKQFLAEKFRDAGWETSRFLKGLHGASNLYCQEVVQVVTDTWSKGRVVLLGDAAYCPSPFSGLGTTGSFVGAYVLAGEIARNPENLPLALQNYDRKLRPFVNEIQILNRFRLRAAFLHSQWLINLRLAVIAFLCSLGVPRLVSNFVRDKSDWELPQYHELHGGNETEDD